MGSSPIFRTIKNPRNQADFGGFSWLLLFDRTFDLYNARNQADFGHFAAYGAFSAPAQRQTGASGPQGGVSVRFMGQKTAYDRRCGKPQGLAPLQKPVADRKESTERREHMNHEEAMALIECLTPEEQRQLIELIRDLRRNPSPAEPPAE